jgi:hypothetical protein
MPGEFVFASIFIFPAMILFIYLQIIKFISLSRFSLMMISLLFLLFVYAVMIYMSYFIPDKVSSFERFFTITGLYFLCFIMFFSYIQDGFKKAYYPTLEPNKNFGKDCSDIAGYYENPKKATIVAHIYRKVLFSGYLLFALMFASRAYYDTGMQNQVVMFITEIVAIDGILFFCCMSFFRLLVKCPNCETPVFYIDQNLGAFFIVAKRVIKERILDCVYCKATYALDPNLDLDELRAKKKAMLAEKKNPDELYP